jgi:hypothetical protein
VHKAQRFHSRESAAAAHLLIKNKASPVRCMNSSRWNKLNLTAATAKISAMQVTASLHPWSCLTYLERLPTSLPLRLQLG